MTDFTEKEREKVSKIGTFSLFVFPFSLTKKRGYIIIELSNKDRFSKVKTAFDIIYSEEAV